MQCEANFQADQNNPAVSETSEGRQGPTLVMRTVWSSLLVRSVVHRNMKRSVHARVDEHSHYCRLK